MIFVPRPTNYIGLDQNYGLFSTRVSCCTLISMGMRMSSMYVAIMLPIVDVSNASCYCDYSEKEPHSYNAVL
jgi:hypothetical protein